MSERVLQAESANIRNSQEESQNQQTAEIQQLPEIKEVSAETKQKLEKLNEDIKKNGLSIIMIKDIIDNFGESENKHFILGSILSGLNKKGISIETIKGGKIFLKEGKKSLKGDNSNISSYEETKQYEELINNALKVGKITEMDLQMALLYRNSSTIDEYMKTCFEGQNLTTSSYALFLLKKHGIFFEVDEKLPPEEKEKLEQKRGTKEYFQKIYFGNEANYEEVIGKIKNKITDSQAEKEFLIGFFDDIYYQKGKNIREDGLQSYKTIGDNTCKTILNELSKIDEKTSYSLGIRNSDDAKEIAKKWSNNPIEGLKDVLTNPNAILGGLIFGIIGAIFGRKKGFFLGGILGLGLFGGGTAFAGEIMEKIKDGKISSNPSWDAGLEAGKNTLDEQWEWMKKTFINVDLNDEIIEEGKFLFSSRFNKISIDDGGLPKNFFMTNFLFLHDNANNDIGKFKIRSFPNIHKRNLNIKEQQKLKFKLNDYWEKLKQIYPGKSENEIKNEIKDKNFLQIVIMLYSSGQRFENTKQEIAESNINKKETIIGLLKTFSGEKTIGEVKKLNAEDKLIELFVGEETFYNDNKQSISDLIKIIIDNEKNDTTKIKDIL